MKSFLQSYWLPFTCITIVVVMFFWPMLFGHTLFFGDNFALFVPQRLFLVNELKHGELPLWNPYILNGVPYFANISKAVLYPATYLFAVFQPGVALNLLILSHLIISGVGMYWLTKKIGGFQYWQSFLAACLWMFSIPVLSAVNNIVILQTLAWIPWLFGLSYLVFIRRQRSSLPWLILVTVLHIFGGHTQPVVYAFSLCSGVVGYAFWSEYQRQSKISQTLLFTFVWGATALLLSSIILVPLMDYAKQTTRVNTTVTEALAGSFHPFSMVELLLPYFWSNPHQGVAWGPAWGVVNQSGGYVTILGLASILIYGQRVWRQRKLNQYLLLVAGVSLLLSLGKYFPPFALLYRFVPMIRVIRSPSSILLIWAFAMAMVVPQCLGLMKLSLRLWQKWVIGYVIIVTLSGLIWAFFPQLWHIIDQLVHHKLSLSPFHTLVKDQLITHMIIENVVLAGGLSLIGLYTFTIDQFKVNRFVFQYLLIICVVLELSYVDQALLFYAPNRIYQPHSEVAQDLQQLITPQDRFVSSVGLYPWTGLPSYWENIVLRPPFQDTRFTPDEQRSFDQLTLRRDLLATDWGMPYNLPTSYGYSTFVMRSTAQAFKLNQAGSNINEVDMHDLHVPQLSEFGGKYIVVDKTMFTPQFWSSELSGFELLIDRPNWALYRNPHAQPIITSQVATINHVQRTANTLQFETQATRSTQVLIKETYEKGWRAWVNNQPTSITSLGPSRLITVPSGVTHVIFRYEPQSIKLGAILSLLGAASFAGVVWWTRARCSA